MVREGFQMSALASLPEKKYMRFLLLALGGILTGLMLVFPKAGALEWISFVPAAWILLGLVGNPKTKLRHAYGYGLFFFMSFYLVIYHWFFYLYPLEFTGMSRGAAVVVVLLAWIGLSLLQALSGGLVFLGAVLLGRTRLVRRCGFLMPFIAAALWCIFEWSQTFFWTGVPWGRLAIGQSEFTFMLQTASIAGPYLLTFLIVAVNFLIAYAIYKLDKVKLCAVCAAGMLAANAAVGGIMLLIPSQQQGAETLRAAVIQANISSSDKWDMALTDVIEVYESYTRSAAEDGAELIIWAETAIPVVREESPRTMARLSALSAECGVPLLVGMFTRDDAGLEYNSLVLIQPDGSVNEEIYSKRHLVPFGEYMPMRTLLTVLMPPLSEIAMLDEDLTPGADSGIINAGKLKLGSLICFDSIYEELTRRSVLDGAQVIVLSTNDSWFFDSAAGRMHNAQAKLRAVESGRWVLRAANTGISSVITPQGVVTDEIGALEGGYIVADIFGVDTLTFYTRTGNLIVYLMIGFLMSLAVCELNKKTHVTEQ